MMPVYEYKCAKCGGISEFLENAGSKAARACAGCGSKKLDKQFSTFAPGIKEDTSKHCYGCSDNTCPHAGR